VRWLAAALSAASAAIHYGYAPHHLQEDWAHGWFFVIATAELFAFDPDSKQFLPLGMDKP
jgi:hypothetical protein